MAKTLRQPEARSNPSSEPARTAPDIQEQILGKLESIDRRLRRMEGKPPPPSALKPPDRQRELAGYRAYKNRQQNPLEA